MRTDALAVEAFRQRLMPVPDRDASAAVESGHQRALESREVEGGYVETREWWREKEWEM